MLREIRILIEVRYDVIRDGVYLVRTDQIKPFNYEDGQLIRGLKGKSIRHCGFVIEVARPFAARIETNEVHSESAHLRREYKMKSVGCPDFFFDPVADPIAN